MKFNEIITSCFWLISLIAENSGNVMGVQITKYDSVLSLCVDELHLVGIWKSPDVLWLSLQRGSDRCWTLCRLRCHGWRKVGSLCQARLVGNCGEFENNKSMWNLVEYSKSLLYCRQSTTMFLLQKESWFIVCWFVCCCSCIEKAVMPEGAPQIHPPLPSLDRGGSKYARMKKLTTEEGGICLDMVKWG